MGFGKYSPDYHKPYNKSELLEYAAMAEGESNNLRNTRIMGKNTLRYEACDSHGKRVGIVYHKTRILALDYDESDAIQLVIIDSGGWNTLTTRDRLNRFLPSGWRVYTDSGFLYVRTPAGTWPNVDSAIWNPDGTPCTPELHKDSKAESLLLKRKIDKFCRALDSNPFPEPSAGDPWIIDWNPRKINRDILLDWLESEYVNGSLIVAALRRKQLTDTGISMAYHFVNSGRDHDRKSWVTQIKRACRDYFKAGLGLG